MERVADILERVCPCGGDPTGPMHPESLLHRQWLLGQGLRHDPLPDARRQIVVTARSWPVQDDWAYQRRAAEK